jgi:hypothetical protein
MRATFVAHLILLDLVALMPSSEAERLWSSSLREFLQPRATSSLWSIKILLSIFFQTLSKTIFLRRRVSNLLVCNEHMHKAKPRVQAVETNRVTRPAHFYMERHPQNCISYTNRKEVRCECWSGKEVDEAVVTYCKIMSEHSLGQTQEKTKNLIQERRPPGWETQSGPLECGLRHSVRLG